MCCPLIKTIKINDLTLNSIVKLKIKYLLLLMVFMSVSFSTFAYDFKVGGLFYNITSVNCCHKFKAEGAAAKAVIVWLCPR